MGIFVQNEHVRRVLDVQVSCYGPYHGHSVKHYSDGVIAEDGIRTETRQLKVSVLPLHLPIEPQRPIMR